MSALRLMIGAAGGVASSSPAIALTPQGAVDAEDGDRAREQGGGVSAAHCAALGVPADPPLRGSRTAGQAVPASGSVASRNAASAAGISDEQVAPLALVDVDGNRLGEPPLGRRRAAISEAAQVDAEEAEELEGVKREA